MIERRSGKGSLELIIAHSASRLRIFQLGEPAVWRVWFVGLDAPCTPLYCFEVSDFCLLFYLDLFRSVFVFAGKERLDILVWSIVLVDLFDYHAVSHVIIVLHFWH